MRNPLLILPFAAAAIFGALLLALNARFVEAAPERRDAEARQFVAVPIRLASALVRYHARVVGIHDADTMTVMVDLGLDTFREIGVRFDGIDAPELNTPEGKASAAFVQKLLADEDVVLVVNPDREREKFGRLLATVWVGSTNVCELLVQKGMAVEYHGGKRVAPTKVKRAAGGVDWDWHRGVTGDVDAYGQKEGGP